MAIPQVACPLSLSLSPFFPLSPSLSSGASEEVNRTADLCIQSTAQCLNISSHGRNSSHTITQLQHPVLLRDDPIVHDNCLIVQCWVSIRNNGVKSAPPLSLSLSLSPLSSCQWFHKSGFIPMGFAYEDGITDTTAISERHNTTEQFLQDCVTILQGANGTIRLVTLSLTWDRPISQNLPLKAVLKGLLLAPK